MSTASSVLLLSWSAVSELLVTFTLIFGGCCSNALTLEIITSEYSPAGTLITFVQFLFVALVGLRKQLLVLPERIPHQEAIQRVSKLAARSKAKTISVYGKDEHTSADFARELAYAAKGTISDTIDEVRACEASTHSYPGIKSSFNIIRKPHLEGSTSRSFQVLLQTESIPAQKLDAVIDISDPDYPTLLHPRSLGLAFNPLRYRLKKRRIPFSRYVVQVLLFLLISLLNNAAFAYHVPMAVHIIFRSGGLVVNMLLGWAFEKRRYSKLQVVSVALVTLGVTLTTLSSTQSKSRTKSKSWDSANYSSSAEPLTSYRRYATGILILTLALLLSGTLGLVQDHTFARYGRGNWEEAMFYLHALALPLFGLTWRGLVAQVRTINSGPKVALFKNAASPTVLEVPSPLPYLPIHPPTLRIPAFYIPLALNVLTQVFCVAGVNRLTSSMNSLTVSLVLVVRKAVSLAISVLLLGSSRGNVYLWTGAAAVLAGTIGYTIGSREKRLKDE